MNLSFTLCNGGLTLGLGCDDHHAHPSVHDHHNPVDYNYRLSYVLVVYGSAFGLS